MSVLNRKLGRDLLGHVWSLLPVIAVIAVGTGLYIGLATSHRILVASQADYYNKYRFADFWVHVKKAPLTEAEKVARLPGIAAIDTRVVFDVILDLPGVAKPISGRLISMPERGFEEAINGICLVRGSGFSHDRDEEVILGEAFAQEHLLEPGDRISLILNRKRESFVIAGTAISPEYVYMVRGQGDILPDPKHFGILYVKEDYAREVLDFKDAFNELTGLLVPGYDRDVDILLDRIDRMLDPYGVLSTTPRSRQASHRFLSDEIRGLRVTSTILPVIFLGVAAMVLNILLRRMAERQRVIIGTLKSLGYSDRSVLLHFIGFGVVVGLIGGVAGVLVGVATTGAMIEMYKSFFQFPSFTMKTYPDVLLIGVAISVAFSTVGAARGVWRVLKLEPAEAMRPAPPEKGGAVFLERFPFLWKRLSFRSHIAIRSLVRNYKRSLGGVLATGLSAAIIFMTLAMYDATFFLVDYQYEQVLHSDADIGMRDDKSIAALYEARALPGVDYAEPLLSLVCDLTNGRYSRRMAITGLPREHRLTTPRQADYSPIDIPPSGLAMSSKLAEILHLKLGDHVQLTPVRGRRETVSVPVNSIVESFLGLECYADLEYLSRIVDEAKAVNAVQLAVNPAKLDELFREIKELPNAQGLSLRADAKANIDETLTEVMASSLGLTILFAGLLAFGTMLNSSLIEIGDRTRDISTFRVLGYKPLQVAGVFFRQNLIISALGLAAAYPFGYAMNVLLMEFYDTELYRMPVVIRPSSIIGTALSAALFVLITQYFVYRTIRRLDWVEGLKVKE
jgi:putative ABC transport system permease protein